MVYAENYEKMFNVNEHLYIALHDKQVDKRVHLIEYDRIASANWEQYGVFHTIHSFKSNERKNDNIKEILFWAIDIDDGTKQQMQETIKKGLKPSYIVETKKGYHIYWKAICASVENYSKIMQMLIEYYNADKQAKDLARILRVAGYNHWKQDKPFLCKEVLCTQAKYTEDQIMDYFKKEVKKQVVYSYKTREFDCDKIYEPNKAVFQGERNGFINRYGYILKTKNNVSDGELLAKMSDYNNKWCNPPLSEREVQSIWGSLKNVRV
jgi:hypothetical protein